MINNSIFQSIIDTIPNPTIITSGTNLLKCNKSFLDFFEYKSIEEFLEKNTCVCNLFIEHNDYFSLEKLSEKDLWTEYIYNTSKKEKVSLLDSHGKVHNFEININILNTQSLDYVVIFTDITSSQQEMKDLEKMAYYDPLTNIHNRQMFSEMLKKEKENQKRHGDVISLIMFDIDHFKSINDTHGHQVGDKVLVSLTQLVSNSLRANDVFARWGGEEFMILLPRTDVNRGYEKAQELRDLIANYKDDSIPNITVSFGVTALLVTDKDQSCFKRVDQALYGAKIRRNDVVKI